MAVGAMGCKVQEPSGRWGNECKVKEPSGHWGNGV